MNDPAQIDIDVLAYAGRLEKRIKELEAALATVRELRAYDRHEIEQLRSLVKEQTK